MIKKYVLLLLQSSDEDLVNAKKETLSRTLHLKENRAYNHLY